MTWGVLSAGGLVVLAVFGGCTGGDAEGGQSQTSSTVSDAPAPDDVVACELLQGSEFSRIPEAIEYQGLDGSVRHLRQRAGPNIGGDAHIFIHAERADRLDKVVEKIAAVDGVSVVGTLDQEEVYEQFLWMFDESDTGTIHPSILPPTVAVELADSSDRSAVEAMRNWIDIYDVNFRDDVGARLLASVRLVQEQFESEVGRLSDVERPEVREAAAAFAALGSPDDSASTFPLEVIAAVEPLMEFVDTSCREGAADA